MSPFLLAYLEIKTMVKRAPYIGREQQDTFENTSKTRMSSFISLIQVAKYLKTIINYFAIIWSLIFIFAIINYAYL